MNIIAVDDEISSLQIFLSQIISIDNLGYKFFKDDVDQIIKSVDEADVSAAFIDVNMPNINGVDLAGKLISHNPEIKIVFVTGINVTKDDLPDNIKENVLGFIYKPYTFEDVKRYVDIISHNKTTMQVKMFDTFDCFINGKTMSFSSSKSKELFALIIAYNGKTLEMNDAISQLWPDIPLDNAKRLYRDAVWRLRKTLQDYKFPCVDFSRAQSKIIKDNIKCDYWSYLKNGKENYKGNFCKSYDWSIDYVAELDEIKDKKGKL